jgi:hypothetical protein
MISGSALLLYQFTKTVIVTVEIVGYHCYQLPEIFYPIYFSQG